VNDDKCATLVEQAKQLTRDAESAWRWKDRKLDYARIELDEDLGLFCRELDESAVFQRMPAQELDYDYLWLMFLSWGAPGTEAWDNEWLFDSPLRALPVEGFFIVLASLDAEKALWWLTASIWCHFM